MVNNEGIGKKYILTPTNVKALYTTLVIPFTVKNVGKVFHEYEDNISGIDYQGLYISFNRSPDERRVLGLCLVCPTLPPLDFGRFLKIGPPDYCHPSI